jgi:hypothetical protein
MRVLVTGSREWTETSIIRGAMRLVQREHPPWELTLVHGGAVGADTIAGFLAGQLGWEDIEVHRPVWRPDGIYNPKAGFERNIKMVDSGIDLVLAFILNGSGGATQCARYAESKRLPVIPFYINSGA